MNDPTASALQDDVRPALEGQRVLVVAREAIRIASVLRGAGFTQVSAARSTDEALSVRQSVSPGMILVEVPDPRLIDGNVPVVLLGDTTTDGILRSVNAVTGKDAPLSQEALNAALAKEVNQLRKQLKRRPLNREILTGARLRAMEDRVRSQDIRMRLIEDVTRCLNDYVRYSGDAVEQDVLDFHLDALKQLNYVPFTNQDEAVTIVNHLTALVAKRRRSRKVAS